MDNHPVPQNVTTYEFRLVGDMTLKQFFYLAGGIVIGFVLFRLPIIGIIKIPLALLSVLIGTLMAFMPINGRPFSAWITAFFRAIYAPTEFFWSPDTVQAPPVPVLSPVIPPPTTTAQSPAPQTSDQTQPPAIIPQSPLPPFSPIVTSKMPHVSTSATQTTEAVGTKPPAPPTSPPPSPPQTAPPPPPSTAHKLAPPPPSKSAAPKFTAPTPLPQTTTVSSAPAASVTSMISSPTDPNIIAGLVTDSQNQPLSGTTIEIIDTATNIPARALRTNKLGQFQIAIPLPAGSYNVIVEKENFAFDPVSVTVKGAIVPPVIIQGRAA